jgi:hypothetical protein
MHVVREGDVDRVDLGIGQDVGVRSVHVANAERGGHLACALDITGPDRHHPGSVRTQERRDDAAPSDLRRRQDSPAQLVHRRLQIVADREQGLDTRLVVDESVTGFAKEEHKTS